MSESAEDGMNVVFYKIVTDVPNIVYVGSTTNFKKRCIQHKHHFNKQTNATYKLMKDKGETTLKFEIIEEKECMTYIERITTEARYIKDNNAINCIKINNPGIKNNKDAQKEYRKEYREKNKNAIKEHYENSKDKLNKQYICDVCKGKYTYNHKSTHIKTQKHQKFINKQL